TTSFAGNTSKIGINNKDKTVNNDLDNIFSLRIGLIVDFHPALRLVQQCKPKLAVEGVCISRRKYPPSEILQLRMVQHRFHQPFRNSFPTIVFINKHITNPSK